MEKKKAVIIGADGRFCALLAEAVAGRGIGTVTLTAKGQPIPQCGESHEYASHEALAELCERITEEGAVDFLVVNVLTDPEDKRAVLHETGSNEWQNAKRDSMDMIYEISRRLIAPMAQRGGRVLFIGSVTGVLSAMGHGISSAMSAGTGMLMQAIAVEGGAQGITANALLLGPMEGCWGGMASDARLIDHIPQKRLGRAEEAVSLAAYTLLDAPDYFSGNVLKLDGALTGGYMRNW